MRKMSNKYIINSCNNNCNYSKVSISKIIKIKWKYHKMNNNFLVKNSNRHKILIIII